MAPWITSILTSRWTTSPLGYVWTLKRYDQDYNVIEDDDDDEDAGPFQTVTYTGSTEKIPATMIEKMLQLMCTQPHQAIIIFHQHAQGKNFFD